MEGVESVVESKMLISRALTDLLDGSGVETFHTVSTYFPHGFHVVSLVKKSEVL